jgi:hypothetical protein
MRGVEDKLAQLEASVAVIQSEIHAVSRVFSRIIDVETADLEKRDTINRELLNVFRDAFAYAIKMKREEKDTEDVKQWVREQMSAHKGRRTSISSNLRAALAAVLSALVTAVAARYLGPHGP